MPDDAYHDVRSSQLILRDHLALDRTTLANDRTLLAYLRTSLALLCGGLTLLQFFTALPAKVIGCTFFPLATVVLVVGAVRYRRMRRALAAVRGGAGAIAEIEAAGTE